MQNDVRNIVFHIRPWEVNLYVALEEFLSKNSGWNLHFLYITHHAEAEYLLKKKNKESLNINRELKKIPFPADWQTPLQALEDRCKGSMRNFQQYLAAERYLKNKSRQYQMQQLYRTVMFFDSYFARHKPFFMLSNGPDHMAFWLAMDLLRYHSGHPCGLVPTSWPKNQIIMFRQVGENYWGRQLYSELLERGLTQEEQEEASRRQESLRTGQEVPIFIRADKEKFSRKRRFWERVQSRCNFFYWQVAERCLGGWHVQPIPIPGPELFKEISQKVKARLENRYVIDKMDWQAPFVFFPLHLEPEATVMVHSNIYDSQLELIRVLSKSLPVSWVLVLKDHPNMAGNRPFRFIREVKHLPNVLYIRPDEPSWRLIQKARIVVTLTGTAGLEACLLGRPVLIFGDPPWRYAPTCRPAGDLKRLPETLLETAAALPPEDERVQAFLLSWLRANPDGVYDYFPWVPPLDEPDNVIRLGQSLLRLLDDLRQGKTAAPPVSNQ